MLRWSTHPFPTGIIIFLTMCCEKKTAGEHPQRPSENLNECNYYSEIVDVELFRLVLCRILCYERNFESTRWKIIQK